MSDQLDQMWSHFEKNILLDIYHECPTNRISSITAAYNRQAQLYNFKTRSEEEVWNQLESLNHSMSKKVTMPNPNKYTRPRRVIRVERLYDD